MEKAGRGKEATVTETREHTVEERRAFNGAAEGRCLFAVARLSIALGETV